MITIPGHNLKLNIDSGSQFYVEFRPGVIIQRGIKTWGHNSTYNHDPGQILTWNLDPGHNSTWNYDPVTTWNFYTGSHFNVKLWVKTSR